MKASDVERLLAFDRQHLWHPYASMAQPPPANLVASASGTRIRLHDGTELIDAVSSWWCVVHGHNPPAIIAAIQEQAAQFAQVMFAGFTHRPAIALAEALLEVCPPSLNRVFYADTGSIAVECALKMASQYQVAKGRPKRCRMATIRGGYHGDTTGAMAVSEPAGMHEIFHGIMVQHLFAPQPQCEFDQPWRDDDFAPMDELLRTHRDQLAAVIVEPIFQGANAMRFYHPQYLRKLRELCSELDILLILDEIATGFGRTGKFFAQEHAGIVPDIMCISKALTGGAIALSAVLCSSEVADGISAGTPSQFMHGPTFMASPLACAAGCASLQLFKSYDWAANVRAMEAQLRRELAPCRELSNVKAVRVLGATGVLELEKLPSYERVQEVVMETGVWIRPFDHWLYTMPPFITTPAEISRITAALRMAAE
jgi:adenosylmethionine-8-amino-7-oxononanoate aminotransferase